MSIISAAIDMRKDDLIGALEQHLHANATRLSHVPELKCAKSNALPK